MSKKQKLAPKQRETLRAQLDDAIGSLDLAPLVELVHELYGCDDLHDNLKELVFNLTAPIVFCFADSENIPLNPGENADALTQEVADIHDEFSCKTAGQAEDEWRAVLEESAEIVN